MMNFLKNEKGYALLLTFGVLLIFSILGLSMLTLTSNSVKKNETRQSTVHATDLADKGVDIVVKDIQKSLESKVQSSNGGKGLSKAQFEITLDSFTTTNDKLACPTDGSSIFEYKNKDIGITLPGANGAETKVCIESVSFVTNKNEKFINGVHSENDKALYKRLVTFKSFGLSNDKQALSTYEVVIGTDAIPDQLRYAVSSNDGGDLHFFGGVHVQGDIKSSRNIYINRYPYIGVQGNPTDATLQKGYSTTKSLSMKSDARSVMPKIILPTKDNFIKYQSLTGIKVTSFLKSDELTEINLNEVSMGTAENTLKGVLHETPNVSLIVRETPPDSVDISGEINKAYNDYLKNKQNDNFKHTTGITDSDIDKYNTGSEKVIIVGTDTAPTKKNGLKENTLLSGSGIKLKEIKKSYNKTVPTKLQGKYYVRGNMEIGNFNSNGACTGTGETIQIQNNAILYVEGDVKICNTSLTGLNNGTLFIFATGTISTMFISNQSNTPTTIEGFFYTKGTMDIYGIYSNIIINGGISGKNIFLTGVRGNTSGNTTSLLKNSRLQVIYNEELIKQFTSFKRDEEEEFIIELNDPEVINRY